MNFLESVGSLTLILGALYLYFNNKDKQEREARKADEARKQLRGINRQSSDNQTLSASQSMFNKEVITPSDNLETQRSNRDSWLEILEDERIPTEFKKIVQSYLLPYRIDADKFLINSKALDDYSGYYVDYENNKHFSRTLLEFLLNPGLRALGYPSWFYAAFPDVAMWTINAEGNKLFKAKYSHYTEAELLDPESKKRLSDKILTDTIDTYISAGNSLECCS